MKKIVVPGLVAGLVMLVVGVGLSILFEVLWPGLKKEYSNFLLFRAMKDPLMQYYFVHPFAVGLIIAWIWDKAKKSIPGKGNARAINFATAYWVVTIPGMLMTYACFKVSLLMVLSWTVTIYFQALFAGLVFTKLNK